MAPNPSKQASALFRDRDYEGARELLLEQVADEPDNVKALLLLGKTQQLLHNNGDAAQALRAAVKLDSELAVGWKGLIRTEIDLQNWDGVLDSLVGFVRAVEKTPEDQRALATDEFQRVVSAITRSKDTAAQNRLLRLQLPDSPIFPYLQGRMFDPATALRKLVTSATKALNTELSKIDSRAKMSISHTPEKVAKMKLAAYAEHGLEDLLEQLLDLSDDDAERRTAEAQLLDVRLKQLTLMPAAQKAPVAALVRDLADGMMLFNPHNPDAFFVTWDWSDPADYSDLDPTLLRKFVELFPKHGLSQIIEAFLHSSLSPFSLEPSSERSESGGSGEDKLAEQEAGAETALWSEQAVLEAFDAGYQDSNRILLALRILSDFYLQNKLYERALQLSQEGLRLVKQFAASYGISLPRTKKHLNLVLATAYIYVQPPKNFELAAEIFDSVLKSDKSNVIASIGRGLILLEQDKLEDAEKILQSVAKAHPDNYDAVAQLAWCQVRMKKFAEGRAGLQRALALTGNSPAARDNRALLNWRIGYSFWQEDSIQDAFQAFVKSLNENPSYAPAFTYLGLFYSRIGDETRATRAFHKALEIDGGESQAGMYLASNFADEGQWDLVEIVAQRVLNSDKLDTQSVLTGEKLAWPYRALGIVSLNKGNFSDAVSYFQRCLRILPHDANLWVGLGEAYTRTGRYKSAEKALIHATVLDPTNISAYYELSMAQRETLQFAAAAESIATAIRLSSADPALIASLVENHIGAARTLHMRSFLGDAAASAAAAVAVCAGSLGKHPEHQTLWTGVANACEIFLLTQYHSEKVPLDELNQIRQLAGSDALASGAPTGLAATMVLCCEKALEYVQKSKASRAVAHFNVALSQYKVFMQYGGAASLQNAAIDHVKHSITLEPRNELYWNFYGVVLHSVNPEVAQHCFVRSLVLNGRSSASWTNLGVLYLTNGDAGLASDALDRALTTEPSNAVAWLGQALVESVSGRSENVGKLVEQSYTMSSGQDKLSKRLMGHFSLENAFKAGKSKHLFQGIWALEKLLNMDPADEEGLLLMSLLLERAGAYDEAVTRLEQLEASGYKESVKLHSHLSRVYLGAHQFDKAVEVSLKVLDADAGNDESEVVLSAMLTNALAHYFAGDFTTALEMLTTVLEGEHDRDVVLLLVQVLWAQGGEDERAAALEQLYESVGEYGPSLKSTLLLGLIGFLSKDADIIEATRDELVNSSIDDLARDTSSHIQELLARFDATLTPYYRGLMYFPTRYQLWRSVDSGMALQVASQRPQSMQQLSDAYVRAGGLANARRAVFYAPSSRAAWQSLAHAASEVQPPVTQAVDIDDVAESVSELSVA